MARLKTWLTNSSISLASASIAVRVFFIGVVYAQTLPSSPINSPAQVKSALCSVAGWMFDFLIVLSVIMALWAAYTYITASDDAEKVSKARKILTYAALGIIVALIANGFPAIVGELVNTGLNGGGGAC